MTREKDLLGGNFSGQLKDLTDVGFTASAAGRSAGFHLDFLQGIRPFPDRFEEAAERYVMAKTDGFGRIPAKRFEGMLQLVLSSAHGPQCTISPLMSETTPTPNQLKIRENIRSTLELLGEDVHREGLKETPRRWGKAMEYLTSGYTKDIDQIVGNALFKEGGNEMVIIRDIELFSLCEHHLLPFYGKAHVAYIPNGKVIGLSKIPRIVDAYARRLQVQERMTNQISAKLMQVLEPYGVGVIIEAFHLCMMMRGVEKQSSYTITSSMIGSFRDDEKTRKEFLSLLALGKTRG